MAIFKAITWTSERTDCTGLHELNCWWDCDSHILLKLNGWRRKTNAKQMFFEVFSLRFDSINVWLKNSAHKIGFVASVHSYVITSSMRKFQISTWSSFFLSFWFKFIEKYVSFRTRKRKKISKKMNARNYFCPCYSLLLG